MVIFDEIDEDDEGNRILRIRVLLRIIIFKVASNNPETWRLSLFDTR